MNHVNKYCECGHIERHHKQAAVWLPVNVCTWRGCQCVDFVDTDRTWRVRRGA